MRVWDKDDVDESCDEQDDDELVDLDRMDFLFDGRC